MCLILLLSSLLLHNIIYRGKASCKFGVLDCIWSRHLGTEKSRNGENSTSI